MESVSDLIIEDVEVAFRIVLKTIAIQFPLHGVLLSQLYTVIHNKSDVDGAVAQLREEVKYKLVSCKHCGIDDCLLMDISNYVANIQMVFDKHILSTSSSSTSSSSNSATSNNISSLSNCRDKFISFIQTSTCMSISKQDLMSYTFPSELCTSSLESNNNQPNKFTLKDIDVLIQLGCITIRAISQHHSNYVTENEVYWISHPHLGLFIHHVLQGRDKLITFIRSRKYK